TSSSGSAPSSTNRACKHLVLTVRTVLEILMRILWLKSDLLLPLDKGGRLRTWHLMRHLATRHDITYLSFAEAGQEREVEGMREVAAQVVTVPRSDPAKRSLLFYMDAARY